MFRMKAYLNSFAVTAAPSSIAHSELAHALPNGI